MTPDGNTNMIHMVDGVAAVVAAASFVSLLPPTAAVFTIIWTGMRIYEMVFGVPFSTSHLARWLSGRL